MASGRNQMAHSEIEMKNHSDDGIFRGDEIRPKTSPTIVDLPARQSKPNHCEEDEVHNLLGPNFTDHDLNDHDYNNRMHSSMQNRKFLLKSMMPIMRLTVFTMLVAVILDATFRASTKKGPIEVHTLNNTTVSGSNFNYLCPTTEIKQSLNDKTDFFEWYHEDNEKHSLPESNNIVSNISSFLTMPFDGWGYNFLELKKLRKRWKVEAFGRNLKSNDKIYESACGEGLNLLMTSIILEEKLGIENLTLYGNDYIEQSVNIANQFLDLVTENKSTIIETSAKKGFICNGDSAHLNNVPSDFFDLVYTGYIDPIVDPLDIDEDINSTDSKLDNALARCNSSDPLVQKVAVREQAVQEEWFASWISEMIRIAAPGKVIIIEETALPLCITTDDWGGVSRSWWEKAIHKYRWDVTKDILMQDSSVFDLRYHVMLKKNDAAK